MAIENENKIKRINDSDENGVIRMSEQTIREREVYAAETDEIHLRQYIGRVYRRKYIVIGVVAVIMAATIGYLLVRQQVYQAQTRIQVDADNNALIPTPASEQNTFIDRAYFNTQLELLTSPGLIRRTVKKLGLDQDPNFLPPSFTLSAAPVAKAATVANETGSGGPVDHDPDAERLAPYVAFITASLDVEPVLRARQAIKDTRLIQVGYSHPDPVLATRIANTLADELVTTNLDKRMSTNTNENKYLHDNINELTAQIKTDEQRLLEYGRNYQLPTLEGTQNTVVERLVWLYNQLLVAENEPKIAEAA